MLSVGGEACRSSRVQTTLFSKVKKRSGNQKKAGRPVFDISEHLSLLMPAEEWCNQFCWGVNAIFWQVLIVWCLSSDALSTVYLFLTVADIIFEDLQLYICVCHRADVLGTETRSGWSYGTWHHLDCRLSCFVCSCLPTLMGCIFTGNSCTRRLSEVIPGCDGVSERRALRLRFISCPKRRSPPPQ